MTQTGAAEGVGSYELRVRDAGMGMSPEFVRTVFEAYARERTAANIAKPIDVRTMTDTLGGLLKRG